MNHCLKTFNFLIFLFVGSLTAYAQSSSNKGTVADLRFIEGEWIAKPNGKTVEGVWLTPRGENILGFMRMMKDDNAEMYEILAYEQTEKGLISLVKHFKPGLLGLEDKEKQDRYNFIESSTGKAIFEKEGEPLRILYEKRSPDQFVIARGNQQDGKWVYKDLFVFNRIK
ncbi:DUF6265 family protein [Rubrolithibacter danxiaensis]|uniref:DUF6265 family protein n=1 Tax=Rubrolithibacter danxiaensis TaxID=3390805 RepID=UPI003BF8D293